MKNKRGFTLIEFVLVMTAGVVIATMAFVLLGPVDNWVHTKRRRAGASEGQAALMRMIKEIRHVKTPGQITNFNPERLTFVDVDDNTVDFQKSGNYLMRGSDVLANNIQSLNFTYYDKDGNVAATAGDIRVIRAELALTVEGLTIRFRSAERIRNL
jgi:prepilin-type N-terminal cleavage/methylation domain-containing protein